MGDALTKGYLQIYTGNGKGKTTAAIGLAIRAAGSGMRVLFAQFLKSNSYSEHRALERFNDCIEVHCFGTGEWVRDSIPQSLALLTRKGMDAVSRLIDTGTFGLVVLDESITAVDLGLMTADALLALVQKRPFGCEIVLTGRGASRQLLDAADLVTEMVAVRHYFEAGVAARSGIER